MRIGLILKQDFQIENSKLVFTNMYCICSIPKVGTLTLILSWFKIQTRVFFRTYCKVASSSLPQLVARLGQQHLLKEQKCNSSTSQLVANVSAQTYLQPHYSNGVFSNVYLSSRYTFPAPHSCNGSCRYVRAVNTNLGQYLHCCCVQLVYS